MTATNLPTQDLLLSIDVGTQSVRALLFDLQGSLLAKARQPIEPYFSTAPGLAEQQPEVFWQALCQACLQLWQDLAQDPANPLTPAACGGCCTDHPALAPSSTWIRTTSPCAPPSSGWTSAALKDCLPWADSGVRLSASRA